MYLGDTPECMLYAVCNAIYVPPSIVRKIINIDGLKEIHGAPRGYHYMEMYPAIMKYGYHPVYIEKKPLLGQGNGFIEIDTDYITTMVKDNPCVLWDDKHVVAYNWPFFFCHRRGIIKSFDWEAGLVLTSVKD